MAFSTRILTSFAVETGGMSAMKANKMKIAGGRRTLSREKVPEEKRVLRIGEFHFCESGHRTRRHFVKLVGERATQGRPKKMSLGTWARTLPLEMAHTAGGRVARAGYGYLDN